MKVYTDFDARACLAEGLDIAGPRTTEVDVAQLTVRQRRALASITSRSDGGWIVATALYPNAGNTLPSALDQAGISAWLDRIEDAREERQREDNARRQREADEGKARRLKCIAIVRDLMTLPEGALAIALKDYNYYTRVRLADGHLESMYDLPYGPERDWLLAAEVRIRQQRDAAAAATRAAQERDEEAKENAKRDYIAAWIADHGDQSTKDRLADRLLARSEAIGLIANATLDPIAPAYDSNAAICDDRDCPCGEVEVESLARGPYSSWVTLRDKLPDGSTHRFLKVKTCRHANEVDEDGESYQISHGNHCVDGVVIIARLCVPCGPFKLARDVKLS